MCFRLLSFHDALRRCWPRRHPRDTDGTPEGTHGAVASRQVGALGLRMPLPRRPAFCRWEGCWAGSHVRFSAAGGGDAAWAGGVPSGDQAGVWSLLYTEHR